MTLKLYNTLQGKKAEFVPYDESNVGMYVCGPTVYNRAHIGNARAVVVYDVLFRLLCQIYGDDNVKYIRNITDVDDKINAQAKENGESISDLTQRVEGWFADDMVALGNLLPTKQPRATEHMQEIIELIERIIANGHAYESADHVLFDVGSVGQCGDYFYGKLSGKKLEDLIAGARVDVADYKKSAGDFVLWKPSNEGEPAWDSPWGQGRPGWHIECSAMSVKYLGENFDIHGGGVDLKFPHHENEIAQSCCGNRLSSFAKYWIHNGFLTVNGEKMSKSLGNFITVKELLDRGVKGEVIRYVLLSTHYRKPSDFSEKSLEDAQKNLDKLYGALELSNAQKNIKQEIDVSVEQAIIKRSQAAYDAFFAALNDDLNTPKAISELYIMAKGLRSFEVTDELIAQYQECANMLGLLQSNPQDWLAVDESGIDISQIELLIEQRNQAKANKNWAEADQIRDKIIAMNIEIKDSAEGTSWKKI